MNKKHILLDIQHVDAPLGLGLILGNLDHVWYVPADIDWKDITGPAPAFNKNEANTERHLACGAKLYWRSIDMQEGQFDLVITGRWENYHAIRKFLPSKTKLGFYAANRFALPAKGIPNVIGGTLHQPGQHYFLKRVPDYWFGKYPRGYFIISLVNHLIDYDKKWCREWWHTESILQKVMLDLESVGFTVKSYGVSNPDGWIYDHIAFRLMNTLLHIKAWGSGSDWSVLKACARGLPCIVSARFTVATTHARILDPASNIFLTESAVADSSWLKKFSTISGEGNRDRLKSLYKRGIPEAQVAAYLKNVFK